ncbi:MAG: hypothetical protein FWF92_08200 [Oscillospiraceae bacterium]|nr:hypothetical protein [Oscillospiraceae bacterium]
MAKNRQLTKKHFIAVISIVLAIAIIITSVFMIPKIIGGKPKNGKPEFEGGGDFDGLQYADETLFEFLVNKPEFMPGNSKAFRTAPVEGLTISAEENALDYDREFKISEPDDKMWGSTSEILESAGVLPLMMWRVDAGLSEGEILPGTYKIEFDLAELDIDESGWDELAIFHVSESGIVTQLTSKIIGGKLTAECGANFAITVGVVVWTATAAAVAAVEYMMYSKKWEGMLDGADVGDEHIDTLCSVSILNGRYRIWWCADQVGTPTERAFFDERKKMQDRYNALKLLAEADAKNSFFSANRILYWSYLRTDKVYNQHKDNLESMDWLVKNCATTEVNNVIEAVHYSDRLLKTEMGLLEPWGHTDILIKTNTGGSALATVENPLDGYRYIDVNWKDLVGQHDKIFMTMAHELFHVFHGSRYLNPKETDYDTMFMESCAILLEDKAAKYFTTHYYDDSARSTQFLITTPDFTEINQYEGFATPLNCTPKENSDAVNKGYAAGGFFRYLRDTAGYDMDLKKLIVAYESVSRRTTKSAVLAVNPSKTEIDFYQQLNNYYDLRANDFLARYKHGEKDMKNAYKRLGILVVDNLKKFTNIITEPVAFVQEANKFNLAYAAYARAVNPTAGPNRLGTDIFDVTVLSTPDGQTGYDKALNYCFAGGDGRFLNSSNINTGTDPVYLLLTFRTAGTADYEIGLAARPDPPTVTVEGGAVKINLPQTETLLQNKFGSDVSYHIEFLDKTFDILVPQNPYPASGWRIPYADRNKTKEIPFNEIPFEGDIYCALSECLETDDGFKYGPRIIVEFNLDKTEKATAPTPTESEVQAQTQTPVKPSGYWQYVGNEIDDSGATDSKYSLSEGSLTYSQRVYDKYANTSYYEYEGNVTVNMTWDSHVDRIYPGQGVTFNYAVNMDVDINIPDKATRREPKFNASIKADAYTYKVGAGGGNTMPDVEYMKTGETVDYGMLGGIQEVTKHLASTNYHWVWHSGETFEPNDKSYATFTFRELDERHGGPEERQQKQIRITFEMGVGPDSFVPTKNDPATHNERGCGTLKYTYVYQWIEDGSPPPETQPPVQTEIPDSPDVPATDPPETTNTPDTVIPTEPDKPTDPPAVKPGGNKDNFPTGMGGGKIWYLYYELNTDKDANEPLYWYYYSAVFDYIIDGLYSVSLTPLDGGDYPDNPYYPGLGHMPAFSIEATAILDSTKGELMFMFNGEPESSMLFDQWENEGGFWRGMSVQSGDEIRGEYSKVALLTDMP